MANILGENWKAYGNSFDDLYEAIDEISKATKLMEAPNNDIAIITLKSIDGNGIVGYRHQGYGTKNFFMSFEDMKKNNLDMQELLDETAAFSVLMEIYHEYFFVSPEVLVTLTQRAGTHIGVSATDTNFFVRFHRDAGYAAFFEAHQRPVKILYRETDGFKKVYAVFSEKYEKRPQNLLVKPITEFFEQELGRPELRYYEVTNPFTEVYTEFPAAGDDLSRVYNLPDKIVPGVMMQLSDTGESSVIIQATMRKSSSMMYIPKAIYKRAHTKNASIEEVKNGVKKSLFSEYTVIPERMTELLTVTVKNVETVINGIEKKTSLKKAVGLKGWKQLRSNVEGSFMAGGTYSAYDVAERFLAYTEEYTKGVGRVTRDRILSAFTEVVFYEY